MYRGGDTPRVSVVTVTKRPGSIDITWDGLRGQTMQEFEWVLCDELFGRREAAVGEYVDDPRLVHIPAPVCADDLWNLNKSYNEALRHCRGELVVSLQDYIWIPPGALERFWHAYEDRGPKTFICGVTATYALPAEIRRPVGAVTIFETPWTGPPAQLLRVDEDRFCFPPGVSDASAGNWEINWGGAPLAALFDVGGFAEEHDAMFYSCDNVTVATVAEHLGYDFVLDRDNICRAIDHSDVFPKPADWEERHGQFGPWEAWHRRWKAEGCPRFAYLTRDGRGGATAQRAPRRAGR